MWTAGIPAGRRPGFPAGALYNRVNRAKRTSAFHGAFFELSDGQINRPKFPQNTEVPFVLFLSDYPAAILAWSQYNDISHVAGNALPLVHNDLIEYDCAMAADVDGAPYTSLLTASAALTENGGLTTGTTIANGVPVEGYVGRIDTRDTGYQSDGVGTACELFLFMHALACAPVVDCPIPSCGSFSLDPGATGLPYSAVGLLDQADYTGAIRAAGDVLTDVNGTILQIVGLWGDAWS